MFLHRNWLHDDAIEFAVIMMVMFIMIVLWHVDIDADTDVDTDVDIIVYTDIANAVDIDNMTLMFLNLVKLMRFMLILMICCIPDEIDVNIGVEIAVCTHVVMLLLLCISDESDTEYDAVDSVLNMRLLRMLML